MTSYKVVYPEGTRYFFTVEKAKAFWLATKKANMYHRQDRNENWKLHPWYNETNWGIPYRRPKGNHHG